MFRYPEKPPHADELAVLFLWTDSFRFPLLLSICMLREGMYYQSINLHAAPQRTRLYSQAGQGTQKSSGGSSSRLTLHFFMHHIGISSPKISFLEPQTRNSLTAFCMHHHHYHRLLEMDIWEPSAYLHGLNTVSLLHESCHLDVHWLK